MDYGGDNKCLRGPMYRYIGSLYDSFENNVAAKKYLNFGMK